MRVPRLRWPAVEGDVAYYEVYRWRGVDRPINPSLIMLVQPHHTRITIRAPLETVAPNTYRLPLMPVHDSMMDLLVDGISTPFEYRDGLIYAMEHVESWQLVEAVFEILGCEVFDYTIPQAGVEYFGPIPFDYSLQAEFHHLYEREDPQRPGHVILEWQANIIEGGGTLYSYEVRAVGPDGARSGPSPIRSIAYSEIGNIMARVERTDDGITWVFGGFGRNGEISVPATLTKPAMLTGVQANYSHSITSQTIDLSISWDAPALNRQIDSSIFRLVPMLSTVQIGEPSVQVGPIPVNIPLQGIRIRVVEGTEVPTPTGSGGTTVVDLDPTITTFVIPGLTSFKTYTFGIFVQEVTGVYSDPVLIQVTTDDLSIANPAVDIRIL